MRTAQFYAETVTVTSSRKANKNLSCVGQAVQLAVASISGRTTWTLNFRAIDSQKKIQGNSPI